MVARFIAGIAGLAGAVIGSQAPGFTLQYMQNLNGRVDELRPIVEQFDADVARYGYTRQQAIAECGTAEGLLDALCSGYMTTIERYELLFAHLNELKAAGIYVRPLLVIRGAAENPVIKEIGESVMKEFKPAVPVTLDGAAYAAGGFVVLWGGLSFIFGLLGALFGVRR
jgi:hypothetical protein